MAILIQVSLTERELEKALLPNGGKITAVTVEPTKKRRGNASTTRASAAKTKSKARSTKAST